MGGEILELVEQHIPKLLETWPPPSRHAGWETPEFSEGGGLSTRGWLKVVAALDAVDRGLAAKDMARIGGVDLNEDDGTDRSRP